MKMKLISVFVLGLAFQSHSQSTNYVEDPVGYVNIDLENLSDGGKVPNGNAQLTFQFNMTSLSNTRTVALKAGTSFGDDSGINAVFVVSYDEASSTYTLTYNSEIFNVANNNIAVIELPITLTTYSNWLFCEVSTQDNSGEMSNPIQFKL